MIHVLFALTVENMAKLNKENGVLKYKFTYLGFNVSYCLKEDINIKLNKFQRMCGTIRRTLRQKTLQSNN
jgi:hypothetical protein